MLEKYNLDKVTSFIDFDNYPIIIKQPKSDSNVP